MPYGSVISTAYSLGRQPLWSSAKGPAPVTGPMRAVGPINPAALAGRADQHGIALRRHEVRGIADCPVAVGADGPHWPRAEGLWEKDGRESCLPGAEGERKRHAPACWSWRGYQTSSERSTKTCTSCARIAGCSSSATAWAARLPGEVASQLAADVILERLETGDEVDASGDSASSYLPWTNRLGEAVRRSNEVIYHHGLTDPRRAEMGTTVVGAWVNHHIASVAHVGDSRAYLWHDNGLQLLTCDHSLVRGAGSRRRSEPCAEPGVQRAERAAPRVGRRAGRRRRSARSPGGTGKNILLCSDGLTRMVQDAALADAIGRPRAPPNGFATI